MRSELFSQETTEVTSAGLFTKQNSKMLKANLQYGGLLARHGAMVAYQGQAEFAHEGMSFDGAGVKKALKKAFTGEGLDLMRVSGDGEVFFADMAADVHIINLENDKISINGMNILAFSADLQWDIEMIRSGGMVAGGLFNTTVAGTGQVAITTKGTPVVLEVGASPTFVDPDACVCWSDSLQISPQISMNFQSFIGRDSGEGMQLAFNGQGWVIVQPAETQRFGKGQRASDASSKQQNSTFGGLSNLMR